MSRSQFIGVLLLLVSVSSWGSSFPRQYDEYFKAAEKYLPEGMTWQQLKAQCYQESRLNPKAISPVGAQGLCQFMPNTWNEMQKYGLNNPWSAKQSIRAAAIYMNYQYRFWSSKRPLLDKSKLATANYNAGAGNILKAQKKCVGSILYAEVIKCLPDITGKHHVETITYVELIHHKWLPAILEDYNRQYRH